MEERKMFELASAPLPTNSRKPAGAQALAYARNCEGEFTSHAPSEPRAPLLIVL